MSVCYRPFHELLCPARLPDVHPASMCTCGGRDQPLLRLGPGHKDGVMVIGDEQGETYIPEHNEDPCSDEAVNRRLGMDPEHKEYISDEVAHKAFAEAARRMADQADARVMREAAAVVRRRRQRATAGNRVLCYALGVIAARIERGPDSGQSQEGKS